MEEPRLHEALEHVERLEHAGRRTFARAIVVCSVIATVGGALCAYAQDRADGRATAAASRAQRLAVEAVGQHANAVGAAEQQVGRLRRSQELRRDAAEALRTLLFGGD